MKRVVAFAAMILVIAVLSALADDPVYIGPEDDPYVVSDPEAMMGNPETPPRPLVPSIAATGDADTLVDTVIISQLDCGMYPRYCMYVDVLDEDGYGVAGLTEDDFCVTQDGNVIDSFSVVELTQDSCITSICLVIDVSGSMNTNNKIGAARSAAHQLVNQMDIYDRVAIVTFSNCYNVVQDFTSDTALLHQKINTISANGYTAVFDGIYKGIQVTIPELGSKAVIAMSDGMENYSQYCDMPPDGLRQGNPMWSWPDPDGWVDDSVLIVDYANGAGIPVTTISLGQDFDPQYLISIAAATNGYYYHAPDANDMDFIYEEIKFRLCSRYLICYDGLDSVQNGDWHTTQVCYQTSTSTCAPCDLDSCQETSPPVITRTPPTISLEDTCQRWDNSLDVCAWVADLDSPPQDLTVRLFYRTSGSNPFTQVTMTPVDTLYCYTIPATVLDCDADTLQYYITASDGQVTVSNPPLAPLNYFGVAMCENFPPTVDAGADQTIAACSQAEICWPVTYGDPDGNLELVEKISGPGTFNGSQICFTPTGTYNYEFVMRAVDSCGLEAFDTVAVYYSLNNPPVANAGADQNLFLCASEEVCWNAGCTDPDGNLSTCTLISGPGTYNGTQICFTPTADGSYEFVLRAEDACGATDLDTVLIAVTFNSAPVCTVPEDTTITQCTPQQVCLPWSTTDVDGNFSACTIASGPGSLVGNTWCYTPSGDQTVTVTLHCEDACGAFCESTFVVTFDVNQAPSVSLGTDTTIFLCASEEVCVPYTVTDPEGFDGTLAVLSAEGTLDEVNGTVCFTPTAAGTTELILQATDACGAVDVDTVNVLVTFNTAPTANAGTNQSVFQCTPTQICWNVSCADIDGNLSACDLISPLGTYNGSQICFTPTGSGSYEFILKATDACGAEGFDTVTVDVTLNSAPSMTAQGDTSLFLCTPQEVCVGYSVTDPDGLAGSTESMVSGYGVFSAANDQACFTPTTAGTYEFVFRITDACGVASEDTVQVTVTFGEVASISCPLTAYNVFLCGADSIIQPLTVSPLSATVSVSEGTFDNGAIRFFAATAGTYVIEVIAEEACGADTCEVTFNVGFNSPPTASAGSDQSLFQCAPTEICWSASCSDVDGNLSTCELISPVGTYNGSQICFTPTGTGSYEFILRATDACGEQDEDTVTVDVTMNSAPTIAAQADTSVFLCTPQQVCVTYTTSDADGPAGLTEDMLSGFGTLDDVNDQVCFTPTVAGTYEFILEVTDNCGVTDVDTVVVDVTFGQFASITCPANAYNRFLCGPDSVIQALAVTPAAATVSVSEGIYDNGAIRFFAATAGTYVIEVIAEESCGADTCEVIFNVAFNSPPVASAGSDQSVSQCTPTEICWNASCSDVDGNLSTCELVSPIGTYNGSEICFTPTGTGSYEFILRATDACGATDDDTVTVDVTLNSAPTITAQADTSLFLCAPQAICLTYDVSDPNGAGGLTETMLSGFGTLNDAANEVCFTPTVSGTYEFVIETADPCGLTDQDTVVVAVAFGQMASIDCPTDTIFVSLCDTVEVCQMLAVSPDTATVSVSLGTYSNGEHCFLPDSSGVYEVEVIAEVECGADTCQLIYKVDIGQAAELACPAPQTRFICQPGQVCIPISLVTPGATVDVSPIGSYQAGNICFTADTTGHYEITVTATTDCGSDQCIVVVDVTINSNPVAVDPITPVDTFMCAPAQVCYQFTGSDVDNNGPLTWSRLSGNGSITDNGLWCFNATADGSYSVVVEIVDACGATDTTTITYNVDLNSAPVVTLDPDATVFLCDGAEYCFSYAATDTDDNITSVVTSLGTLNESTQQICFTPPSSGTYEFDVTVTDACGAQDVETFTLTVQLGSALTIDCPADTSVFLCGPAQVCRSVAIPVDTAVTVTPIGTYSGGEVCFMADTAGHYEITVETASDCGSAQCTFVVDVAMNAAPVAIDPTPVDTFMCAPAQVCFQFQADDADAQVLTWTRLSGNGSISTDGLWCFNAGADGSFTVTVEVADPCGGADTTTMTYNVDLNAAPVLSLGPDQTGFICQGSDFCVDYTLTDSDDNVVSVVSSLGVVNEVDGEVCITPAGSGTYEIILTATDACGALDVDTINVTVTVGEALTIDCPADTTVFLCMPNDVCRPVTIPVDTSVVVTPIGTYANGEVCFPADTAGHYEITVQTLSDCGTAECTFAVDVDMNAAPVAVDPTSPVDTFMCASAEICYQFEASDADHATLAWQRLSGNGAVTTDGLWCFTPSASGTYTVSVAVTDGCGAADTTTLTYNVTMNSAPVVTLPDDATRFLCQSGELCFDYTATDVDDNLVSVVLLEGDGIVDEGALTLCFTPANEGAYTLILQATDECGASDVDTIVVTVDFNEPPIVTSPPEVTAFLCESTPVTFGFICSDPNNNLEDCTLLEGDGTVVENGGSFSVEFTPTMAGAYQFILQAVDSCGLTDVDTTVVLVTMNEPPVCQVPNDTTIFQCTPTQVTLETSYTDADDNGVGCELVSGPGSLLPNGSWVHTPNGDGVATVVIRCTDECGAACQDTFVVTFDINDAPVVDAGDPEQFFFCSPSGQQVCWDATCLDVNGNLDPDSCRVIGNGSFQVGQQQICYTLPANSGTYPVILRATDDCGVVDADTTYVTVKYNSAPTIGAPSSFTAFLDMAGDVCFGGNISDVDNNLTSVSLSYGTYNEVNGQICFPADTSGVYCLDVIATDACGAFSQKTICVEIEIDECLHVQIEKVHDAIQGQRTLVDIYLNGSGKELSGFDLLIAYDQTALTFYNAVPGELFEDCGWEYFTYRFGDEGNCAGCPSGLVRIVALAETNNGAYHPGCYLAGQIGSLATMSLLVTNDRNLECQYAPIQFFWKDCADNGFSSRDGDTLWVSRQVFSFEHTNITDYNWGFPGYYGVPDSCMVGDWPDKPAPIRCIDYTNGGVDIICADSIDAGGDVNLNGIPYEIADAVVFTNYFIRGLSAFTINVDGQIAATEVNGDGIPLSVADLVTLIRIVVGDEMGLPKIDPGLSSDVVFSRTGNVINLASPEHRVGALHLIVTGEVSPTLTGQALNMDLLSEFDGESTHILVYAEDANHWIEDGPVLDLHGKGEITIIDAATYEGASLVAKIEELPGSYNLSQNYPNPFNPVTTIEFALPTRSEWKMTIYNILGQQVEVFSGEDDQGFHKIEWDASDKASGVYFYRLQAGSYTNSKKMVLIK